MSSGRAWPSSRSAAENSSSVAGGFNGGNRSSEPVSSAARNRSTNSAKSAISYPVTKVLRTNGDAGRRDEVFQQPVVGNGTQRVRLGPVTIGLAAQVGGTRAAGARLWRGWLPSSSDSQCRYLSFRYLLALVHECLLEAALVLAGERSAEGEANRELHALCGAEAVGEADRRSGVGRGCPAARSQARDGSPPGGRVPRVSVMREGGSRRIWRVRMRRSSSSRAFTSACWVSRAGRRRSHCSAQCQRRSISSSLAVSVSTVAAWSRIWSGRDSMACCALRISTSWPLRRNGRSCWVMRSRAARSRAVEASSRGCR